MKPRVGMKTRDLTLCVQWNHRWPGEHDLRWNSPGMFHFLSLETCCLLTICLTASCGDASTLIANYVPLNLAFGVRLPPAWLDLTVPWGMQSTSQIPSPGPVPFQAPHLSLNPPPSSWLRFTISRLSIQRTCWDGSQRCLPLTSLSWFTCAALHGLREQV